MKLWSLLALLVVLLHGSIAWACGCDEEALIKVVSAFDSVFWGEVVSTDGTVKMRVDKPFWGADGPTIELEPSGCLQGADRFMVYASRTDGKLEASECTLPLPYEPFRPTLFAIAHRDEEDDPDWSWIPTDYILPADLAEMKRKQDALKQTLARRVKRAVKKCELPATTDQVDTNITVYPDGRMGPAKFRAIHGSRLIEYEDDCLNQRFGEDAGPLIVGGPVRVELDYYIPSDRLDLTARPMKKFDGFSPARWVLQPYSRQNEASSRKSADARDGQNSSLHLNYVCGAGDAAKALALAQAQEKFSWEYLHSFMIGSGRFDLLPEKLEAKGVMATVYRSAGTRQKETKRVFPVGDAGYHLIQGVMTERNTVFTRQDQRTLLSRSESGARHCRITPFNFELAGDALARPGIEPTAEDREVAAVAYLKAALLGGSTTVEGYRALATGVLPEGASLSSIETKYATVLEQMRREISDNLRRSEQPDEPPVRGPATAPARAERSKQPPAGGAPGSPAKSGCGTIPDPAAQAWSLVVLVMLRRRRKR